MKEATIAIIDNRPLIAQALTEQFKAPNDMRVVAVGQTGDDIFPIADHWQPDIFIIATDLPQTASNDNIRFQPIRILRILNRRHPDTQVILLVNKHIPVLAHLAAKHLGVMGYILMQDPRITHLVDVIRHVLVGRRVYSKSSEEDLFNSIISKRGLSDTQIFILCALVTDPNLSQQQLAEVVGISYGTLRTSMSQLFKACGARTITGTLMATNAWDIRQFQLNQ
jgi:DNA-binding NarL/FixJ family response regulator